jgi:hypothetical protein
MSPQEVKEESKLSRRMSDRQHDTALFRAALLHAGYSATKTDIVPFHCGLGLVRRLPDLPCIVFLISVIIVCDLRGFFSGAAPHCVPHPARHTSR